MLSSTGNTSTSGGVDYVRKEAEMILSFLAIGATCRTEVSATTRSDPPQILIGGRTLSAFEWKALKYRVEASSLCESADVANVLLNWRRS